ncbi:MAG: hypothetical protein AUJ72_01790 [Candidatus Omnitrophica bacterium CG1_02_46_14]|nr:MAG: hypothetical protein AUJ72_01790 [Candidatus Omnitrophica bacterium CG1_02_46_14]
MYADMDLYNLMIGRYTNFRSSDFSSAAGNLLDKRYHDRLLLPDGDAVVRRIQKEKPLLLLMVHYIFHQSELLFDAFQDNLDLYILTVRHPLWLFEAWYGGRWDRRIGKDPREFHLSYKVRRKIVPYFASEWNEEYLRLRPVEQAIAVTTRFLDEFERHHDAMPATERKKVFLIPFEKFVRDPQKHLQVIAKRLESHTTALTVKRLKTLRLPRSFDTGDVLTQQNKIENLFRRERVSSKYQKLLRTACDRYERRYLNN